MALPSRVAILGPPHPDPTSVKHSLRCASRIWVRSAGADTIASLAAGDNLPLHDRRILVTAPRQYASKLCSKVLGAGGRPLWLPTIQVAELREPRAQEALLDSLKNLSQYQHLGFSSKNGITAVLWALEQWLGGLDAAVKHIEESGIKCWALGADAETLLQAGLTEVHQPREPSTQGLVRELAERGEAEGRRVLCPVPRVLPPLTEPAVVPRFLASLQECGADAVRVDAYETGMGCQPASCSAERELLMEGEIHAIAFSSTAEAQGLVHLMGGNPSFVHQAVRAHNVVLAAHGPYTAVGVANVLGIPVTCVSKDSSTFDGLVGALAEDLQHQVG